jgi:quercetin dioxygenase-like cupin family protein
MGSSVPLMTIARRRNVIFRAHTSLRLEDTNMLSRIPRRHSTDVEGKLAEFKNFKGDDGAQLTVLYRDPEPDGVSLVHVWFKPNYILPRHTHDVDCLYYIISGDVRMGAQELHAGDGFLIPAGNPYAYSAGPSGVEILEFRHASSFNVDVLGYSAGMLDAMTTNRYANQETWAGIVQPPSWQRGPDAAPDPSSTSDN